MAYPACATFKHEEKNSRLWMILTVLGIKAIALIPHLIALFVLQIAAMFVGIIGVFAVLFVGRYPQGMQNFVVGVIRWGWKVMSYYICLSAKYPPFTMKSGDYPADLNIEHQEKSSRLWALLTIIPIKYITLVPHIIVLYVLELIAMVCIFLGFFGVLFTGKYPLAFERWIVKFYNYVVRLQAFFFCMTDKYPPIGWGCELCDKPNMPEHPEPPKSIEPY